MSKKLATLKIISTSVIAVMLIALVSFAVASIFVPSIATFEQGESSEYNFEEVLSQKPTDAELDLCIFNSNGVQISVLDTTAPKIYDVNKSIVVYFGDTAEDFKYAELWQAEGYNVFQYNWDSFIVEDYQTVLNTIWAETITGSLYQANGKLEYMNSAEYGIADFFVAEFLSYISKVDISLAQEVRFVSNGIGGELATKITSTIMDMQSVGDISGAILPDRVAYLDTIASAQKDSIINRTASIAERGIAQELYVNVNLYDKSASNDLYLMAKNMTLVEYSCLWQGSETDTYGQTLRWYSESLQCPLFTDQSINNSGEYTPSASLAPSYILARQGVIFTMANNYDKQTGEENFFSIDVALPTIAGFAFYDTNGDGVYNERVSARASNVKIELYTSISGMTTLLGSCMTEADGFYCLDISAIYANRFDNLFVLVYVNDGYSLTKRADDIFMMSNDINSTVGRSDYFVFEHRKNVQIVNVGVVINEK